MQKILHAFDRTLNFLGAASFVAMAVVLCLQIFYRYVLSAPLVWATPLSMFFFIWAIYLGAAAGMRDDTQVKVELAERYLPVAIKRLLMPSITLACSLFLLLIIYKSFEIVELQASAIYDTLPFSRAVLFMVVPILGTVMLLQHIRIFVRQIRQYYLQSDAQ